MMKYKALICDVDGTLILNNANAMPSTKVKRAISKASEKIHVSIATSRCLPYAEDIFSSLQLTGPSILQGGAYIYDAKYKTTISKYVLSEAEIQLVHSLLKDLDTPFVFCDNTSKNHKAFTDQTGLPKEVFMIFAQNVNPIVVENILPQISRVPEIATHTTPSWKKGMLDILITHSAATKQHGIFEVAKILNIEPKEIIGIGDGNNDFPLLMACGLKVAMGNAVDELKAIADYIAPNVEQDGVADVIEKYILNNS